MDKPTFDVLFSGDLAGSASSEHVKQRLAQMFKLNEASVERLFSGQRVFVKRGLDHATAERFREVFNQAGALAEVVRVGGEPDEVFRFDDSDDESDALASSGTERATPSPSSAPAAGAVTPSTGSLSVAPVGAELEELSDRGPEQNPDISKLSLVPGDDWSLEDCAPPPLAQPIPDIDSMELEPESKAPDNA
ncbi:Tfp pilus assembly protein, major pilin PilA [Thiorhodovibrio winogradskyi]|uniref:Tfp pilus assembly protein, major pilin PilA n=1 Tax=Thiorhodovibrio winogradskyi TaxID=77007 RepID=A0ABZ0SDZ1_9GAMM|nr:hypothetical protein [Thiorhodovibrio winogradskyi]